MPSDVGSQTVTVKYFDAVDSPVVNRIGVDVRKVGIYSGGYLTKINDTSVSLSTLVTEIGDGTYQVRITTGTAVTVAISSAAPVIVLRWVYTGSQADDYMDFVNVAAGSVLSTDIVVGAGTFIGSTLQSSFDYTLRTNPDVMDLFLKVEPTSPASMAVRVRAGRVNYGIENFDVIDQVTGTITAPVANSRIDLVYIDTDGTVKVSTGTAAASPVAPSYNSKVALAQITLTSASTSITSSMIKDVRSWVSAGPVPAGVIVMWSGTVATVPTGWYLCDGNNGTPDLRDRFIVGAKQDDAGVAKTNVSGSLTQSGGEATHTLTIAEMPAHDHSYTVLGGGSGVSYHAGSFKVVNGITGSTGGGTAHNTLPPYYALAFIMKS